MVEKKGKVLKLKISKKTFIFKTRRRFSHSRQFALPKVDDTSPLGRLRSMVAAQQKAAAKGAKAETAAVAKQAALRPGEKPKSLLSNPLVLAAIAFFILLILGGGAAFFMLQGIRTGAMGPVEKKEITPQLSFVINDTQILTYGAEAQGLHNVYSLMSFSTGNMTSASLEMKVFKNHVPQQVYLLASARDSDESYPDFKSALTAELERRGIIVNEIDLRQTETLPEGTILIVPSGYVPMEMIKQGIDFNLRKLVSRGVVVVFIGLPFDHAINEDGTVQLVPPENVSALGVSFKPLAGGTCEGINLYDPRYTVSIKDEVGGSGSATSEVILGCLSSGKIGKGYIVFFPQTLDGGWRKNGKLAAQDMGKLIQETSWQSALAETKADFDTTVQAEKVFQVFSPSFSGDRVYVKFYFEGVDLNGERRGITREIPVQKFARGGLYTRSGQDIISTSISGEAVRMTALLNETAAKRTKLFVKTLKKGEPVRTDPLEAGETNVQSIVPFDYEARIAPGRYLIKITDSAGKTYAQTSVNVLDVMIDVEKADFRGGNFSFAITGSDGRRLSVGKVTVTVDKSFGQDVSNTDKISFKMPGLAAGDHLFTFDFGGVTKKSFKLNYQLARSMFEDPLFIGTGVFALLIVGAGVLLRRPEKLLFSLDIPDFPPLSAMKIPVKKSAVLDLFEQTNKDYSWKWTPLKLEEIKAGFRKISYRGRPTYIGDYNLERLLDDLVEQGLVVGDSGYYGLAKWETESKRNIKYLAVSRMLRDIFVNNVVRFTPIGATPDYDTKINIEQDAYAHIYEGSLSIVGRALNTVPLGRTFIIFHNGQELMLFREALSSVSDKTAAFKIEVQNGDLILVPVAEFAKMIKHIKS